MAAVNELFGESTGTAQDWIKRVSDQSCPFRTTGRCDKPRKSEPAVQIGTCSLSLRDDATEPIIVCPHRFKQGDIIFRDCAKYLKAHRAGNHLKIYSEVHIPGGAIDFILTSEDGGEIVDFVGIEIQALDTTGSIWPTRQQFLFDKGLVVRSEAAKPVGINYKHTAKTTLSQMLHKIGTFDNLGKTFVLILQVPLLRYLVNNYRFEHMNEPGEEGDSFVIHCYDLLLQAGRGYKLQLSTTLGTDIDGVTASQIMKAEAKISSEAMRHNIERRGPSARDLSV